MFFSKNENWNNVITRLLSYQLDSLLLLLNRIQGVSRIKMLRTTKKLNLLISSNFVSSIRRYGRPSHGQHARPLHVGQIDVEQLQPWSSRFESGAARGTSADQRHQNGRHAKRRRPAQKVPVQDVSSGTCKWFDFFLWI